ncbi:MAG TPA: protein kinase [Ramlibacter sp.]|nr:protein kinase [Ramlibacter sp.]
MLNILIVDDDEAVRRKAMRALAGPQVRLASAADGRLALEQATRLPPDIVICDVDMPGLNGFEVLTALKADGRLAAAQVMMLTSLGTRHGVRLGMSLGADDYLTKPFTDEELVEAVQGLVRKRGRIEAVRESAADQQEQTLRERFSSAIGAGTGVLAAEEPPAAQDVLRDAAVLFADIRGFTAMAEKLSSQEVARLLTEYFDRACEPVLAQGGRYLKLIGDGLMAVFTPDSDQALPPSRRALLAADAMAAIGRDIAGWVTLTFPDVLLPPFRVGFGVHCGEVAVSHMGAGRHREATPIGDTVNVASRLEQVSKELGWTIVASDAAVAQAGGGVRVGPHQDVTVRNRATPVRVHEVLVVEPAPAGGTHPTLRLPRVPDPEEKARLQRDAREHAGIAARAVKDALGEQLSALRRPDAGPADLQGLRLQGFRTLRRLGAGGMSSVYLAVRESDGELVVLKILPLDGESGDAATRFMREFALLSRIRHPHVIRIFNQGFAQHVAYIAMEYFENGDLRGRMAAPMAPAAAVSVARQVCSALAAVHALGIVHRDLKPENLMVRANGQVVLADFGIAKLAGGAGAAQPTLTHAGELLGSPSYMSPEQIAGQHLSGRADLYALGVVLYELLVGRRPFEAVTLVELFYMKAHQPPPTLPAPLAALQPVIDRLIARRPADRFADAAELEGELARVAAAMAQDVR